MRLKVFLVASALAILALAPVGAHASVNRGQLFFDGTVVRTLIPPASTPQAGTDAFFEVSNGAPGQLGIASVAPGSPGYHGGDWAVNIVTFKPGVQPHLLTSAADVMLAEAQGEVTVTRDAGADFRCPIQP